MTSYRTLQDIITELKFDIMRRNPAICDWSPLSVNLTLAQAYSKQIYDLEQMIQTTADNLFVNTAAGAALDKLVVDRLPAGRLPGTIATGNLSFSRLSALPIAILIPAGSIASCPNHDGVAVYFVTTEDVTLPAGELAVEALSQAMNAGVDGNVPANTITGIVSVPSGIQFVNNPLPFTGGTDEESDDDLRKRYIYAVQIPGRATKSMLEQHLYELDVVTDSKVFTVNPGIVEILTTIHPTSSSQDYDSIYSEIESVIIDNLAAGVVAHGLIGATIDNGVPTVNIATGAGAPVYAVVGTSPPGNEHINFKYVNNNGVPDQSGTVFVPAKSVPGTAIPALLLGTDTCTKITAITYTSDSEANPTGYYALTMGEGSYPYLFNEPVMIPINATVSIKTTISADKTALHDGIVTSLTTALNQYKISDDLEFSDIAKYVYNDYSTGTAFVGIDEITELTLTATIDGVEHTANGFGQDIVIQNQQCAKAGTITVTVT